LALKECVRSRMHIREHILLPMICQEETMTLPLVVGMPSADIERELEAHRKDWDPKQRFIEARKMSQARYDWTLDLGQEGRRRSKGANAPPPPGSSTIKLHRRHSKRKTFFAQRTGGVTIGQVAKRMGHPMMGLVNQYRLDEDDRATLVEENLRESTKRWFQKYGEYREQSVVFRRNWSQWLFETSALGPANRSDWPPVPMFATFPYELTKVDQKVLHAKVLSALKHTEAGQLL